MRRSDQRRAAVVALYQHDVTGRPLDELVDARAPTFTRELIDGVIRHRREIDALIGEHAEGWTLERIAPLERNILRVAVRAPSPRRCATRGGDRRGRRAGDPVLLGRGARFRERRPSWHRPCARPGAWRVAVSRAATRRRTPQRRAAPPVGRNDVCGAPAATRLGAAPPSPLP